MANYSKLLGTVIGAIVGIAASWLATKIPGVASCMPVADGSQACTVLGESTDTITAMLVALFAAIGTHQAPPNKPA